MHNDHLLIAFAQEGHPEAIAAMFNYYFNERQIWVKAGWEDETLILLCEASELPSPAKIGPLFAQILSHLHIQRGENIILYGRVQGEQDPCWQVPLAGKQSTDLNSSERSLNQLSNAAETGESSTNEHPGPSQPPLSSPDDLSPQTNSEGSNTSDQFPPPCHDSAVSTPEAVDQSSSDQSSDRFLCGILDPELKNKALELNTVLFPIETIHTILHISAHTILPVPYMTPCVLGLYPYRGQMLWVVDLWQQLTNKKMGDRPHRWATRFVTLVLQGRRADQLIGFTIPQLADQVYHCPSAQNPDPSFFSELMLPFIHQYDPVSRSPILSIDALIQDPRLQMHRA